MTAHHSRLRSALYTHGGLSPLHWNQASAGPLEGEDGGEWSGETGGVRSAGVSPSLGVGIFGSTAPGLELGSTMSGMELDCGDCMD